MTLTMVYWAGAEVAKVPSASNPAATRSRFDFIAVKHFCYCFACLQWGEEREPARRNSSSNRSLTDKLRDFISLPNRSVKLFLADESQKMSSPRFRRESVGLNGQGIKSGKSRHRAGWRKLFGEHSVCVPVQSGMKRFFALLAVLAAVTSVLGDGF